eukprot:gene7836-9305_t
MKSATFYNAMVNNIQRRWLHLVVRLGDAAGSVLGLERLCRTVEVGDVCGRTEQVVKFTRYESGPAPPGQEFAAMYGHGSYELAFREPSLYSWMLEQQCEKCAPPTFELAHLAPSPPSPPPKTFMNLRGRSRGTRNHLPRREVADDMNDVPRQTNLDASERPLEDF